MQVKGNEWEGPAMEEKQYTTYTAHDQYRLPVYRRLYAVVWGTLRTV
jgi:hypothetical protein